MRLLLFFPPNPIKTSSSLYFLNSLRSNLTKRTLPTRRSFIPARMAIPPRSIASAPSCTTTSGRSNINIEEGLASKFWIKFRRESVFAMYTPFVISLASGTLKIDSFRHYISQDSHFLKSFAHAWVPLSPFLIFKLFWFLCSFGILDYCDIVMEILCSFFSLPFAGSWLLGEWSNDW